MIEFELPKGARMAKQTVRKTSETGLRPLSRKYDSYEHEHDYNIPELEELGAKRIAMEAAA